MQRAARIMSGALRKKRVEASAASGFYVADEGKIAVLAVEIKPVSHKEDVIAVQRAKICLMRNGTAASLVNGNGRGYFSSSILEQRFANFFHGKTGVKNIVNYQHRFPLAIGQGIVPFEFAGTLCAVVAGDADGLQLKVGRQAAQKVGCIPDGTVEQAKCHNGLFATEKSFYLLSRFFYGLTNLIC